MAGFAWSTKAEVLRDLAPRLTTARVLPLTIVPVDRWRSHSHAVLDEIVANGWAAAELIVRSSARAEDCAGASLAGMFLSIRDVWGRAALRRAIDQVIASYGENARAGDQVLVQPALTGVVMSGVGFTRDPGSGAPYLIVNYADDGDTSAVTGGRSAHTRAFYLSKCHDKVADPKLSGVAALSLELEALTGFDAIDFEFACDHATLFLLQARPLATPAASPATDSKHVAVLADIARRIESGMAPHPMLHGRRTLFGVMPDWNPAEIIGIRPRPLALSLYCDLITDAIWAYQRSNYGYKNLRSFPLILNFYGLPYIDVRTSFNSFVPNDITGGLADRLVDYYLDCLERSPALHDKVEFEIVFSCYTFDLPDRVERLTPYGFGAEDQAALVGSLRSLTNRIIHGENGLWRAELDRIAELERRHRTLMDADLNPVHRIYWILEECKRYGTLPFAGLARAGFIAVQLLQSLVLTGVLSEAERDRFMRGLGTISGEMTRDLDRQDRPTFLAKYGHLRPGTYDILSPRYDEAPDHYFPPDRFAGGDAEPGLGHTPFALSLEQIRTITRLLEVHGIDHEVIGLFDFLESGIRGREHAKFVFTRSLSDALSLLGRLGVEHGFSLEDMSYVDIGVVRELYMGARPVGPTLDQAIRRGREAHAITKQVILPPLISAPADVWSFHMPPNEPNFVTHGKVSAPVCDSQDAALLKDKIVAITSADPGFDWIFGRGIAGFVTAYGGINSHMAIRAAELGIPAVIGAGAGLFGRIAAARMVEIDCANRQVRVLA